MIDYFSKVKTLIDVKRHRQRQIQRGTSAAATDDDSASLAIYHDYLLAADWPDPQQLNTELLTEAQRARNSQCKATVEWANSFREKFAEPAGNTLGGIRLKVIHDILQREQPMLTGIFSTAEQAGGCPVAGAMFESIEESVQRYVDEDFDRHLKDLMARKTLKAAARSDIEKFLTAELMTRIRDRGKKLRRARCRTCESTGEC